MTKSSAEHADTPPWSVLLAEDEPDLRKLLADALRVGGFSVIECANGLDLAETLVSALEARRSPFDLVVSDVRMPGVSGLSVLEGLTELDELHRLPVILISAFGDPRIREFTRRFRGVYLLEKPFEMTALLRVVREALDGRELAHRPA